MCFKTAGLAAPTAAVTEENAVKEFATKNFNATVQYKASGTREIQIGFGADVFSYRPSTQYVEAKDLRELAVFFNELADKLEA